MSGTTSRTFQAVIGVIDQTAAPLRAIAGRINAIAGMDGLGRLQVASNMVAGSIGRLGSAMRGLALPAALIGGAAIGGIFAMANATIDAGGALTDLSARLGMSIEDIQQFQFAASQAGVEAETFNTGVERLGRGLADAAAGRNKNLAELFTRLGISLRDSRGQIRTTASVLPQLANALQRNENGALRTRMAMALFGRGGGPMIAMLAAGSAALEEQRERYRQLGGMITTESAPALDAVGDAAGEVGVALKGVRDAIVIQLAPALGPMLTDLATWIAANRDLVASRVAGWVLSVAEALKQIDVDAVVTGFGNFITSTGNVIEALGGLRGVMIGLVAVALAPLIGSLTLLGAALIANPITAGIVALVALLAWGIYEIYQAWGGITAWFGDVFSAIGRLFDSDQNREVVRIFTAIFNAVPDVIMAAWSPLQAFFENLWRGVTVVFEAAWRVMEPIVSALRDAAAFMDRSGGNGASATPQAQRERSGRERDRGRAGGFYSGPAVDPDAIAPPMFVPQSGMMPQMPSLMPAITQGGNAAQQRGQVNVRVQFDNVPPGTRVDAGATGSLLTDPRVDVGMAQLGVP